MSAETKPAPIQEMELTRQEFAEIPKVASEMAIHLAMKNGHTRVVCKSDAGHWFVCYPKTKLVFKVKFIQRLNSSALKANATALLGNTVDEMNALRERKKYNDD